jgi:hypothetical protein
VKTVLIWSSSYKEDVFVNNKFVIKDKLYSAFEFIEKNDMYNLSLALTILGGIVEFSLKDFLHTYIHTFSQEDIEEIMKCKNNENYKNQKFDKFTLGRKMGFLRDCKFIQKVEKKHDKSFAKTKKLLNNDFVSMRNKAAHYLIEVALLDKKSISIITKIDACVETGVNSENDRSPETNQSFLSGFENESSTDINLDFDLSSDFNKNSCIIDKDRIIDQYNLIAAVLNELGFEENYDYETTRYNRFYDYFRSINDKYINESVLPFSCNYAIDSNLLSDFQCYNQLSGKFESFNFIKDSKNISSKCLTECNCLISGEGGIGKSTILHRIYEYCKNYNKTFLRKPFNKDAGHEDFCPIPIFISAHKFKISDDNPYDADDLKADISRQIDNSFSFFEETEKMVRLYYDADNNKSFFIFLIDGLNEASYASNYIENKILNILGEFIEITEKKIQVIIASRKSLQPDERYRSMFKEIRALGLGRENIVKYIEMKNPSFKTDLSFKTDITSKLNNIKILDILKNPMLLTLYTGYKYDNEELKKFDQDIEILKKKSKLIIRESNVPYISDIFWNYIEYKVLFHNIFQPVIVMKTRQLTAPEERGLERKENEHSVYLKVICELIPQIAWEMVSRDLFSIELSDKSIINIMGTFYKKNKANLYIKNKERAIDSFVEYMTNSVCLLKCEDEILSFHHQNFRDFFASCHYISEYMPLTGKSKKKTDKIREKLKNEYLSSNLKLFVGELLNERGTDLSNSKIDMPLKEILGEYKLREEPEDLSDHTVENIFEIDKALDVLNPIDYFDLNIDRLNFSDVKADKMVAFVDQMLNNVSIDSLMSEGVQSKIKRKLLLKHNADTKTADMVHKLLMLSARCASNSNKEYLEKYFYIWFIWAKKLTNKTIFNVFKQDMIIVLASGPLTNLLHSYLEGENIGTGEKGILSVFNDISNSKTTYMNLTNVLRDPVNVKISEIVDKTYDLASEGGLASNFVILILDYYIFKNRKNRENNYGKELIAELIKKMNEEMNEEKKTYIRFRLMSGINFCLQESLLDNTFTAEELDNFKSIFKPIMTNLLNDELNSFSDNTADDYRVFKYGYYFPFGILYTFDNGINEKFDIEKNENLAVSKIVKQIFSKEPIDYKLFQKLIFDVACFSTSTFFAQNLEYIDADCEKDTNKIDNKLLFGCNYLENTFSLFKELIYKLYPVDQKSPSYEQDDTIWISLTEAMSILYYNFPLKTEAFFDSIKAHYLKNGKEGEDYRILRLKQESAKTINKKFEQLCQAQLKGNTFIVKDFITNYQNTWLFASLPNNIYIHFEIVRESFVSWGENSFYKNIDIYNKEPKEFVKQTLKEVLYLLDKEEKAKEKL